MRSSKRKSGVLDHPVLASYQGLSLLQKRRYLFLSLLLSLCIFCGMFIAVIPIMAIQFFLLIFGVLALMIIWLLPDTENPPAKAMAKLFFIYYLVITLWPYYLAFQITGFPLIEFRRILSLSAFFLFMISYSVSSSFRNYYSEIIKSCPIIYNLFFAFVIIQLLSIVLAGDRANVFQTLINNQIGWTAIFIISVYIFSIPGNISRMIKMIVFCAIVLCIIAFFEVRNQGILWADHIPPFLQVNDPAMQYLLNPVFRSGEYRLTGPFSVSLVYAEYMAMTVPFFLHYIVNGKNNYLRFMALLMDIAIILAINETQARIGIIGLIIAHGVYGLIWAVNQWIKNKGSIMAPAILLIYPVLFGLFLAATFVSRRLNMMVFGDGTQAHSNQGRIDQFIAAAPLIMKRPIFGYGAGEGGLVLNFRNPAGRLSIDSGVLSYTLDYGIPGLLVYMGLVCFLMYKAATISLKTKSKELAYAAPMGVVLLIWFVSRLVLAQTDNMSFIFIIMGAIAAIVYRAHKEEEQHKKGEIPALTQRPA